MEIIKIDPKNFTNKEVDFLSDAFLQGKVLVFPTDTIPGLLADASNKKAVERIFEIKKRPEIKRLPVFVTNIEMAKRIAVIDPTEEEELKSKWPGNFTFILKRVSSEKEFFGLDKETIALRVPSYPLLRAVLEKCNLPLVQTSVNPSGSPFLIKHEEILEYLNKSEFKPDIVIDVGDLPEAQPSTIMDLTQDKKVLR